MMSSPTVSFPPQLDWSGMLGWKVSIHSCWLGCVDKVLHRMQKILVSNFLSHMECREGVMWLPLYPSDIQEACIQMSCQLGCVISLHPWYYQITNRPGYLSIFCWNAKGRYGNSRTRRKSLSLLWCWCRDCYCLGVLIIVWWIWFFNDHCCCRIEANPLMSSFSNLDCSLQRRVASSCC